MSIPGQPWNFSDETLVSELRRACGLLQDYKERVERLERLITRERRRREFVMAWLAGDESEIESFMVWREEIALARCWGMDE